MAQPNRLLVPVALVLGGIAAGVGLTLFFLSGPVRDGSNAGPNSRVDGGQPPAAIAAPAQTGGNLNANVTALSVALQTPDRARRASLLQELAARMGAGEIDEALELAKKIPDANDQMEFLRALFAAWASKDPKAAVDYAKANFKPGLLLAETLSAATEKWAGSDPRAARDWVEANASGPLKEELLGALVQGWARNDPQAVAAWYVGSGSTSQTLLNALVSTWADTNPKEAAAWVESLPNPENREVARVALASEWAGQDPAAAAQYFTPMLAGKGGQDIGMALVNSWGARDPGAAAEWISKLPAGTERNVAAGTLATIWAASDIKSATAWSEKLEDKEMKAGVIDHLGTTWGAIEPQKAIEWIRTLPQDEARTEATKGAFNSWAGTDLPGLATWVSKAPPGPETDIARTELGTAQVETSPTTAIQTAMGISEAAMREDQVARFFHQWRKTNDKEAQQWLAQQWNSFDPALQARLTREQKRRVVPK